MQMVLRRTPPPPPPTHTLKYIRSCMCVHMSRERGYFLGVRLRMILLRGGGGGGAQLHPFMTTFFSFCVWSSFLSFFQDEIKKFLNFWIRPYLYWLILSRIFIFLEMGSKLNLSGHFDGTNFPWFPG